MAPMPVQDPARATKGKKNEIQAKSRPAWAGRAPCAGHRDSTAKFDDRAGKYSTATSWTVNDPDGRLSYFVAAPCRWTIQTFSAYACWPSRMVGLSVRAGFLSREIDGL